MALKTGIVGLPNVGKVNHYFLLGLDERTAKTFS